jgi:hypothetical protein
MGLLSQHYKTQILSTRGDPKAHFTLYNLEKDRRWSGLIVENSRITLILNSPTHKHCNRCNSLTIGLDCNTLNTLKFIIKMLCASIDVKARDMADMVDL